jgi:hypothetical protein
MKQVYPHSYHPIFKAHWGQSSTSLKDQASVLFCAVAGVTQVSTMHLLDENHKLNERIYQSLDECRKQDVTKREKLIKFGEGDQWKDVEADEVDLAKTFDDDAVPGAAVQWEQWGGIVERGNPRTLVLQRLNPKRTGKRAPGPGAIRKREWKGMALKWLKNRSVVLHTDGARAYTLQVDGVIHDNVVHKKKKVIIKGKAVWVRPKYVKVVSHKLPSGRILHVKAGTQIIDRLWQHLRAVIKHRSGAGSSQLLRRIRSAQWLYWHKGDDLWAETGKMLRRLL